MSLDSSRDDEREKLLEQYGLERVVRGEDDQPLFGNDEEEEEFTEDDLLQLNNAELTHTNSKRTWIPFIMGGMAILLFIGLIIGVAFSTKPPVALRGYAVAAATITPPWSQEVLFNLTYSVPLVTGGPYIAIDHHRAVWLFGRTELYVYKNVSIKVIGSSALRLQSVGDTSTIYGSAKWVQEDGFPRPILPDIGGLYTYPTSATFVENGYYLFWKYFSYHDPESVAWGTGYLHIDSVTVEETQPVQYDRLWDPEATIVHDKFIYVYFLHDLLFGDGQDELYVGRLPISPTSFQNTDKFMTYWNGKSFISNRGAAAPIIDQFGKQTSIVYNEYLKRYLLIDTGYSNVLTLYESRLPYTGWTARPIPIFTEVTGNITNAFFMPSLFEERGQIMYVHFGVQVVDITPRILKLRLISSGN